MITMRIMAKFMLDLDDDLHHALKQHALTQRKTMNAVAREAIVAALAYVKPGTMSEVAEVQQSDETAPVEVKKTLVGATF
jgi:plasmid stability protein